jgi:hypothetical protein
VGRQHFLVLRSELFIGNPELLQGESKLFQNLIRGRGSPAGQLADVAVYGIEAAFEVVRC